jgi:hypothetical protein
MKKVLITTLAALYLVYLSGVTGIVLAAGSADLSITRGSDLNASGQFTVNVNINITSGDSSGTHATFTFDDTVLDYVSGTLSTFYDSAGGWGRTGWKDGPNHSGGTVDFTLTVPTPPTGQTAQYVTGSGVLATFTFAVTTPPAAGQTMSTVFNFNEANCLISNWDAASGRAINILNASPNATINLTGYTATVTHTITSLDPTHGALSGAYQVDIIGTNLDTTNGTITFGSTVMAATDTRISSRTATRIRLTSIPAVTAAGTAAVSVAGATGSLTFTYDAPGTTTDTTNPDISYLDPTSGMADADVVVTIVGTHFGTTSGTVTFGQYTATISSWTDTQIKVTAPKLGQIASSVSYEVRVTRSDGKYDTSYYTYLAPASTGGGTGGETADTGMPMGMWAGLISANGVLAFLVKRKFL